ncbi:hypothetical protein BDV98DRAFT_607426 [Pterulicium gracile]|uniref:NACHT domain-containing protein n=1 Tax=Pterulicium gracile TaxID=1884261 RepID=A0A5C3QHG4_9AGAR|nr:hypothetical protein BDV98DRAFT_607426 [Pterula gracilis]
MVHHRCFIKSGVHILLRVHRGYLDAVTLAHRRQTSSQIPVSKLNFIFTTHTHNSVMSLPEHPRLRKRDRAKQWFRDLGSRDPSPAPSRTGTPSGAVQDPPVAIPPGEEIRSLPETLHAASAKGREDVHKTPLISTVGDGQTGDDVEKESLFYKRAKRIATDCHQIIKRIQPLLADTPFVIPVNVLLAVAAVVEDVGTLRDSTQRALDHVKNCLEIIDGARGETNDAGFRLRIEDFFQALATRVKELDKIGNASKWKKVVESSEMQSTVDDLLQEINNKLQTFQLSVGLSIKKDTKNAMDLLMAKHWFRAPTAIFNGDARLLSLNDQSVAEEVPKRSGCTPGTRLGVLGKIADWINDTASPPIFWLAGPAGTGKSTIAYSVCEQFSKPNVHGAQPYLAASFFCSRQSPTLRLLGNVIPTLAYQLARRSPSFARALESDPIKVYTPSSQMTELFVKPWQDFSNTPAAQSPPLLVVVDALDEIEGQDGITFLKDLVTATNNAKDGLKGLKILVTSRPHSDIRDLAHSFPIDNIYHLETIDKDDARNDIATFFRNKLPDIDHWGRNELDTLLDRADGLFIYAATIWRQIVPNPSNPPTRKKLQSITQKIAADEDRFSGGGMDSLYQQIVEEAIEAAGISREEALAVVHSVILAQRPLSLREIDQLAGVDDFEGVHRTIQSLHAVIRISDNGHIFTYHKSFPDFMLDGNRSPRITCARSLTHGTFAQTCIDTMLKSLSFNMCNLPSSYLFDNEVIDIRERLEEGILGVNALEYSCRFWMSHVGSSVLDNTLSAKVSMFARDKILYWIEAMNLLGARSECWATVSEMVQWCQKSQLSPELLTHVTSVMKLSKLYLHSPACQSTPHLYISALAMELCWGNKFSHAWMERYSQLPEVQFRGNSGALFTIFVNSPVFSVAFSPDGTRVVSGSWDNSLRIWDTSTGEEKHKLDGHTESVYSVAFSSDGTRVVSGSCDNSLRIWDASTGEEKHKLNGHTSAVNSVAFSLDGTQVVSGSRDNSLRIWNASTGEEKHKLNGHTGAVYSVAFSSDGTQVVSGSYDNSLRIWDTLTGEEKHKLDGHTESVFSVAFSPDGTQVVSGSWNNSLRIWDALIGKEQHKLNGHTEQVNSVAFSPDGTRVVSGSRDNSLRIWDTLTGEEKHKLDGHKGAVYSVAFSPDGTQVVSGSYDNSLRIWDTLTGEEKHKLDGHTESVYSVAFSPDGTQVVSGSLDASVRIWDTSTGEEKHKLNGHTSAVNSVAFLPDGTRVASGSDDKSVRIWDISTGEEKHKLEGHTEAVASVAFSPDGARVASGAHNKSVRIWDTSTGKEKHKLEGHTEAVASVAFLPDGTRVASGAHDKSVVDSRPVYSVAFSPDGTWVVSGSYNDSAWIWDASTGEEQRKLNGHTGPVYSVAFSPDGTHVVSGSMDNYVRIWDTLTGEEKNKLDGHTEAVQSVAFSPNGTRVVSGSWDTSVRIWDALTGEEQRKLDGHTGTVYSVAFSPDGTRVVSSSPDDSVRIWDTSTGEEKNKLNGHTGTVYSVAFSPDGTQVVSGSLDTSVRIWDTLTGEEKCKLNGHTGIVYSVAFLPDGTRVASGAYDKSVRIWDTLTGEEKRKLNGHTGTVYSVAFSPDGTQVVSGSLDTSVRIWDTLTGVEKHKLNGHTMPVHSVAFSPDGTQVVSCSSDTSVRIWDALTGEEQCKLNGHTGTVESVAFSPDGTKVASGSWDKSVRVWDTSMGKEKHKLTEAVASAAFSPAGPQSIPYFDNQGSSSWDTFTGRMIGNNIKEWSSVDTAGWILDTSTPNPHRLIWLPPYISDVLGSSQCLRTISLLGSATLDFSSAHLGTEWAQCYTPPT